MVSFEVLGLYIAFGGSVIFILLFGGLPAFQGTPLGKLHWLVTDGLSNAGWKALQQTAGAQATRCCEALVERHCSSSSPVLQVLYALLLAGGWILYCRELFCFLPQPWAPLWHQYTGAAVLGACLASFAVACLSDPGIITPENYKQHASLYAYDGVINQDNQQCWVCMWKRPARSRHCSITDRCIARYDHYCPWIRSTIGILNLRWFMLFLVLNILLCSYGTSLGAVISRGVVEEQAQHVMSEEPVRGTSLGVVIMRSVVGQRAPYVIFKEPVTGRLLSVSSQPRVLLRWTVQKYPMQVALIVFLTMALLLVSAFFAYHLVLILSGMTSYESYKRSMLYKRRAVEIEAEGTAEAALGTESSSRANDASREGCMEAEREAGGPAMCGSSTDPTKEASIWSEEIRRLVGMGGGNRQDMPANLYDRGLLENLYDALLPPAWAYRISLTEAKQK